MRFPCLSPPASRVILSLGFVVMSSCGTSNDAPSVPEPSGPWAVRDGFLHDAEGRVLVLRGANLSGAHKSPPYFGFHQPADYARLVQKWGMNSIRFLVEWAAIEPQKGVYDDVYLNEVAKRVGWARDAGLLVVMDMHQDIYGEGFGGDGAPRWTCDESHYEAFTPTSPWMMNYLSLEVQACYDGLWNSEELHAHYAEAWRRVAEKLQDNSAVVGFDVINEPHWGSMVMASFEEQKLQHFYEHVVPVVRSAAPQWVAFLEPSAGRNIGVRTGLTTFPFPNVVYAPHSYDATAEQGGGFNPTSRTVLMAKVKALNEEARELNAALWIGEYGGTFDAPGIDAYMDAQYDGMASVVASSAYWTYDKGGYGLLDSDGNEQKVLLDLVVRPYPQRVAGTPLTVEFDEATRTFRFTWRPDRSIAAPTVIAVPSRVYGTGYQVECAGCAVEKTEEFLTIASPGPGDQVTLTLRP